MATTIGKTHCVTCRKDKVAYKCEGCSQNFCLHHLADHHQELGLQLDEIEHERNLFQQILTEQTTNRQKHSLIQQVNQWEKDSIDKIRQAAEEARHVLLKHTAEHITQIEAKLVNLTEQLKEIRQENDFNELNLNQFKQKFKQLKEELEKPSNILMQKDVSSFINKISVIISTGSLYIPNISPNTRWIQNGITVAGGNKAGMGLNQLCNPRGMYVDDDQTVYVADRYNNRIVAWKNGATSGRVVTDDYGSGNQFNEIMDVAIDKQSDSLIISDYGNQRVVSLSRRDSTNRETTISNVDCRGVIVDNNGYIYISDVSKSEIRRWKIGDTIGTVVAGGNGQGDSLNQLNGPHHIFVDQDHSVYVSEKYNQRVSKWIAGAKEGTIVAGGQSDGNGLTQLSIPRGIIVDQLGTVYVVDSGNNRVMRWLKGARQGSVIIDGYATERRDNQLNDPRGIAFDRQNNLYIAENGTHRVQRFNIELNSD